MPERVMLNVMINLDQLPGAMHTEQQARDTIEAILLTRLGHYDPVVVTSQT